MVVVWNEKFLQGVSFTAWENCKRAVIAENCWLAAIWALQTLGTCWRHCKLTTAVVLGFPHPRRCPIFEGFAAWLVDSRTFLVERKCAYVVTLQLVSLYLFFFFFFFNHPDPNHRHSLHLFELLPLGYSLQRWVLFVPFSRESLLAVVDLAEKLRLHWWLCREVD